MSGQASPPLRIAAYQEAAVTSYRGPMGELDFPLLGLFGETGSLLSVVKKKQRDRKATGYTLAVIEELGDVLWYFTMVARSAGLSLCVLANNVGRGLSDWSNDAAEELTFEAIQEMPNVIQLEPTESFEKTLLNLAGEVGTLLADFQSGKLNHNQPAIAGRLVAVLRILVKAADDVGVTLEQAAEANLKKIFDRWPRERKFPPPFDEGAKEFEKLPRYLVVEIFERDVRNQTYVFQKCNGINLGDRLTDNAATPDDYRFHDVFHYAYAAVLGWSPVLRALMRLKRKSEPDIDEAQDGARAILIEEGIATWIFGQAKGMRLFENIQPGELSFDLLKSVRQFVSGYEPEHSPLWLWEDAILQGYDAFRFLKKNRRARLILDMSKRRLSVEELPLES